MEQKFSIKKFLAVVVWFAAISGIAILLIAANRSRNAPVCKKVVVSIKGGEENFCLDKNDIIALLKKEYKEDLVGQPVSNIHLEQLEKRLEQNAWIAAAELYFDGRDVLHVAVTERTPVARVFTTAGTSFYMDAVGYRMPLLPKLSIRLPVITNFPATAKLKIKDSNLLKDAKQIVTFVNDHPFWKSQIAQIDITANRNFELIPTLGNHVIRLGTAENLEQKFRSLFVFYRQVVSRTGFDKYAVLDVQYRRQVVAVYKGAASVVDSVKLQRNIEELIRRSRMQQEQAQEDSAEHILMNNQINQAINSSINDSVIVKKIPYKPVAVKKGSPEKKSAPKIQIPTKSNRSPMPEKKRDGKREMKKKVESKNEKGKTDVKKPRAVMPGKR